METKKILEAINLASKSEDLDFELAKLSMNEIMSGEVTPAQFGAFIIAMKMKGETPIEIAGLATTKKIYIRAGTTLFGPSDRRPPQFQKDHDRRSRLGREMCPL